MYKTQNKIFDENYILPALSFSLNITNINPATVIVKSKPGNVKIHQPEKRN